MAWYISVFLGIVTLCALLCAVGLLRNCFSPQKKTEAIVLKRYTAEFPYSVGFVRRNKFEKHLVFQMPDGSTSEFITKEEIYKLSPSGTKGVLTWQGSQLISFEILSASQ